MIPIMIGHRFIAVVLLDGQHPATKGSVIHVEMREETKVGEHANCGLKTETKKEIFDL